MATGDSLSGDNVTIWFAPVGSVGGDLATDGVKYQSFITSFDESGGEKQNESVPVFSDTGLHGNVTRKKPKTQKELTFDVILRHDTNIIDFKKIENGENVVGSTNTEPVGMVAIQQTDGTNYYYNAFNNVDAVVFDGEFSSEEEWRGQLKFQLSPTDADGLTNIKYGAADIATDLTAWS